MTENSASREATLRKLHAKYDGMSELMRNLPTIPVDGSLISPTEALREVEHNSAIGQKLIQLLGA